MKDYYVYILASGRNGTLYTGVTNDVQRRVSEHREEIGKGFTSRYGVKHLVWYEVHSEARAAIQRENIAKMHADERGLALQVDAMLERLNRDGYRTADPEGYALLRDMATSSTVDSTGAA